MRLSAIRGWFLLCIFMGGLFLAGCATTPQPERVDDACAIFRENPKWYDSAKKSSMRWGIPIPVMMAIVHQESGYVADAKPSGSTCLWIIPSPSASSAYGYAQAKDESWSDYKKKTGNTSADRTQFEDAIDFVGWYCEQSVAKCSISRSDAYHLYLAYHEGMGGYNRKTYKSKSWLLQVAQKVEAQADLYKRQLAGCEKRFQKKSGSCLWPI